MGCDVVAQAPCDGTSVNWGTIDRVASGFSNYGGLRGLHQVGQRWLACTSLRGRDTLPASASPGSSPFTGPYTDWETRLQKAVFPSGGFTTSLAIYLDTSWAASHPDIRFDWDSNMNDKTGNFLQDFVFNAATDGSSCAGTPCFVINSSTNANRSGANPNSPCPSPNTSIPPNTCRVAVTITTSGWYRFVHRFFNDSGSLGVEMSIVNDKTGHTVPGADWTIVGEDPSTGYTLPEAIANAGGVRRGYFPNEEILGLPIDNASLKVNH